MLWRRWKRQFYDGQGVVYIYGASLVKTGRVFRETRRKVVVIYQDKFYSPTYHTIPKKDARDAEEWKTLKQLAG